jgi:hypothetical protein
MDPVNLSALHTSLKYLGFGENTPLNTILDEEVKCERAVFDLYTEAFFDEETKLEAKLNFSRSKTTDRYFFNKYTALLRYPDNPEKDKQQIFYIDKSRFGVTFKEAFNLLQGRSVYKKLTRKDGEKYMSWIRLDFAEKTRAGNHKIKYLFDRFALEKTLAKYKIRELDMEPLKEQLIRSLQRGNLHPVTYTLASNKMERKYIYANPETNTIVNLSVATRAAGKAGPVAITDIPDPDPADNEPVNDAIFDEEVSTSLKRAHL